MGRKGLKTKRTIILLIILLFVSAFAFCDTLNFKLTHFVGDPTSNGYFEFWRFGTREMLSNVNLTGGGTHNQITTLGVRYLGTFTISSLVITFSDLKQFTIVNEQPVFTNVVCPYQLSIYDSKNPSTLLINPADYTNQTGNGGARAVIFSNGKSWDSPGLREADTIADFSIVIDDSNVPAGSYQGTITVEVGGS